MTAPAQSLFGRVDAVCIGASAGGVEALLALLPGLPAGLPVPIFVVLHQPRSVPSPLAALFAARCALAVREPDDKEPVRAGTVYFAPPDYHLLLDKGPLLQLSADAPVSWSRPSIDVLFESAADAHPGRLAAVLLSGANDDGAAGLQAVQRAGGVTVVQDPATAAAATMPQAALNRIKPDFVLPLAAIADLLRTLAAARDVPA